MLEQVELKDKTLADYTATVGEKVVEEIRALAEPLRDARVVHINATAFGGGVAEMLQTLVPLMRSVGLDAEWQVIEGDDEFFNVTKACHNGLQGMDIEFTDEMKDTWLRYNEKNAKKFEGDYDFIVIHDPQPAGLLHYRGRSDDEHWAWRCHIDTSHPNPAFWDFFAPLIEKHDAGIFTMEQYVGPDVSFEYLTIIRPAIDPLSPKNKHLSHAEAAAIMAKFGVTPHGPLISQVSRFDPWKDPLGVIDAYRIVKEDFPEVELALMASMASDDPEGWVFYERTKEHAGGDPDIHVLCFQRSNDLEVNALQTLSDVVIQKSTREGFGLVVTEALWKARPVVGGKAGGIPLQIIEGQTGYLVESVEECAERTGYLLDHPEEADEMGQRGREHVRRNFLTTRHLRDYLELFHNMRKT